MAHDLYICHSTKDKPIADAACAALEADGLVCWIAPRDVPSGMPWAEAVLDAISKSRLIVLIFSSNTTESQHVKREIERAVSMGVPVIPLRIEDVTPSGAFDYFLRSCHWIDATTPPLDRHLSQLVDGARKLLGTDSRKRSIDKDPSPDEASNQYDVFISYRRENGAAEARLIRAVLREKNVRVFLDVDDLKSGAFR
jgi:TIR domain-containing protein